MCLQIGVFFRMAKNGTKGFDPVPRLAARATLGGYECGANLRLGQQIFAPPRCLGDAAGCGSDFGHNAYHCDRIVQPRRLEIANRKIADRIGPFPRIVRAALIYPQQPQHVRTGPLEPA